MASLKVEEGIDPSVFINKNYASCLNPAILDMGLKLGDIYVKQGDLVTEEYLEYLKLEAVRVKTVGEGGLTAKLADVCSTQDKFFTELQKSVHGLKSAATVKAGLGVARAAVRVGRIPVPDAPDYDEGPENDRAWKRYQWLFMADGKSKARAQFKDDFRALLKKINPKGARKSDVQAYGNRLKKARKLAAAELEAKEQEEMLSAAVAAGKAKDDQLSKNLYAAATQEECFESEEEEEAEVENDNGPAEEHPKESGATCTVNGVKMTFSSVAEANAYKYGQKALEAGEASEDAESSRLGKRARVSKSESVSGARAKDEELRELREVVEKYEAFIMSKNLEDEFAQFEVQREQDMELEEEQYEQDEAEEDGDDDYDPSDKSSAQ